MTRTPIPNCPQEDKPIRDRAWTDGQINPSTPPAKENAMSEYSAEEVRNAARRTVGIVSAMLTAYAERIKADKGANDRIDFQGMWNAMSDRAYAHPPAQPRAVPDGWSITPEPNPLGGKNAMCLRDPSGRSALFGTFSEEVVVRDFLAALLAAAPSPGESNSKPADCSGDPSSCPDNEGHGCYCSDIRRAGESA